MLEVLKKYDRYDKVVTLSYKKQGSYATSIGGICTIISFCLLTYWVAVNIWFTFAPPGQFSTTESQSLIQAIDGKFPELYIPLESLFTTYSLNSV